MSITLTINGQQVTAEAGDTVLTAAKRSLIYIPTLCHDADLSPAGACRLCIVEIEGRRGFPTSCTTEVAEGMVVRTDSPAINKLRRGIVELALSDHPTDCLVCAKNGQCMLQSVAAHLGITGRRFERIDRKAVTDVSNPFFERDLEKCILCGICVRACEEIVGVSAIDFVGRGIGTRIGTLSDEPLANSNCVSCGECLDRCPTGALRMKEVKGMPSRRVSTVCSYCGCGCGIALQVQGVEIIGVRGVANHPASQGALCVKGRFGHVSLTHPDRLSQPLVRKDGHLVEASWDEALDMVADGFIRNMGHYAAISSARFTNEENYLVQKLTRAVMGTNNVDNSART